MAKKRKPTAKSGPQPRAYWTGNLTFGLVSFPVQSFNAMNREQSDIHFHQLHAQCHHRIRYIKACPVHGEVTNDEFVRGYEYQPGKYVEVSQEELDELRTKSERALAVDTFIPPDAIDPLYFDGRMYYLLPDGAAAEEAYQVLLAAMQHQSVYGVGQVVLSGKQQLVLLRPFDGVLHMALLNYDAEIRKPSQVGGHRKKVSGIGRKVALAETLIKNWSDQDFDFADYEDHYREKVKRLVDAKIKGREIVAPEEEEETTEVIHLMDALQKSVKRSLAKPGAKGAGRKRRRSA